MSIVLGTPNNGVLGIQPQNIVVRCVNPSGGTAIKQYDLVYLDFSKASVDAGTGSSTYPTLSNSKFANVIIGPTAPSLTTTGLYGVAQQAIAAGTEGPVLFAGTTLVTCASATYTAGNVVGLAATTTAGTVTRLIVTQPIGVCLVGGASATQITMLLDGTISNGSTTS